MKGKKSGYIKLKKALLSDMREVKWHSEYRCGFFRGLIIGCYLLFDCSDKQRDKLLEIVDKHFKEDYNWLGKLKKDVKK